MKLIEAIKMIEKNEKRKRRVNVVSRNRIPRRETNEEIKKIIYAQTDLPQNDVIALLKKTGESSIKEAISKAVYHYLECNTCTDEAGKSIRGHPPLSAINNF